MLASVSERRIFTRGVGFSYSGNKITVLRAAVKHLHLRVAQARDIW
jgi:hypothetical protein